jgi:hypothetical protein
MNTRNLFFSVITVVALAALPCVAEEGIKLNEKEYFEGPGFSFLLFHNNYQVGFQGGLQMILHDERVLDSGDLFLVPKQGQERPDTVTRLPSARRSPVQGSLAPALPR